MADEIARPFSLHLGCAGFRGALAQTPAANTTAVAGQVVNKITGEPLRKAHVSLKSEAAGVTGSPGVEELTTTSGADGKFAFTGIEPGRYFLNAERFGFLSIGGPGEPLQLEPGQPSDATVLKLIPQGVLAGHVRDGDGDPVSGVGLTCYRTSHAGGKRVTLESMSVHADEEGYFLFTGLNAGRYYLAVSPPDDSGSEGYVPTFYPEATDISGALLLDVKAGTELRNLVVKLRTAQVVTVAGTVTLAGSTEPPLKAQLLLRSRDISESAMQRFHSAYVVNGRFRFTNVQPGEYILSGNPHHLQPDAAREVYRQVHLYCYQRVSVGRNNIENLSVQLGPGIELHGAVSIDADDTIPQGKARELGITLSAEGTAPEKTAQINDDGSFVLRNLPPEHYRVWTTVTRAYYVRSIKYGGHELHGGTMDLTASATGSLQIQLSPNPAEISGMVQDPEGKPASDIIVVLRPEPQTDTQPRLTSTDDAGHFEFHSLAPGTYSIAASSDREELPLGIESPPQPQLEVTPLTLQEGDRTNLRLTVAKLPAVTEPGSKE